MRRIGVCIEIFNVTNEAGTGDLTALFDKHINLMAIACGPGKDAGFRCVSTSGRMRQRISSSKRLRIDVTSSNRGHEGNLCNILNLAVNKGTSVLSQR